MSKHKYHLDAVQFAEDILRRLGHNHRMAELSGEAELLWDIAYDAFMWRAQPSLALASFFKPVLTIQTDYATEEDT